MAETPVRALFVNVADLVDPNDPSGRTFRQINAEIDHGIPLGALCELESGARLFVIKHDRDCDQTPLYALAPDKDADPKDIFGAGVVRGYSEDALKPVIHG